MEHTFITIHDLSEDARILYSSDSIVDILGHTPDEVLHRSVWDWFHPDDVPVARRQHSRGVALDKAAVLTYARIQNRQGDYISCECCFSIVYDVLVCCTSIYRHGPNSQKRATEAPLVRRMFASSPKDPRYHMLSHLSSKFSLGDEEQTHEPRAALFLNRYTRSLTVMYATSGIEQIIGISSEAMKGRSFYYCIQENCMADAVRCLESAKQNESIAYLRFHFRDPRRDDPPTPSDSERSEDDLMTDVTSSDDDSEEDEDDLGGPSTAKRPSNAGSNTNPADEAYDASRSNSSHPINSPESEVHDDDIELEAVVSCTSDGLVVCLRRARPMMPIAALPVPEPAYHGGIFVAPWAQPPVFQPALPQLPPYPLGARHPAMSQAPSAAFQRAFMQSIRDVAVFAWALTGINGGLADYARGKPQGESQPPEGLPVWAPHDQVPDQRALREPQEPREMYSAAPSGYVSGSSSSNDPFGDPGLS